MGGTVVLPRGASQERRISEWTLDCRDVMEEAAAFIGNAPQHLASVRKLTNSHRNAMVENQVCFVSPFNPVLESSVWRHRELDVFFAEICIEPYFKNARVKERMKIFKMSFGKK